VTEVFEKLLISDFDSEDFDVEYYIDYVLDMRVPLWPSVILEIASTFPQLAEKKCR
jgi:hypothetical protein